MKGEIYEEWRPIKDYEGLYEISNMGRVKSLKRKGVRQDRILTPEQQTDIMARYDAYNKYRGKVLSLKKEK